MPRRVLRAGIFLALALLPASSSFAFGIQNPQDTLAEPVLVEVQLGRITSGTMEGFRSVDEVLLPLSGVLSLSEIQYRRLPDSTIDATLQPGTRHLLIRAAPGEIRLDGRSIPVPPGALLEQRDEIYVGSALLGELLGIRFQISWADLLVSVLDPSTLPVGRRYAREQSHRAARFGEAGVRPDLVLGLDRRGANGAVFDYSLLLPSEDVLGGGAYSAGLGVGVLGGGLEASAATVGRPSDGDIRVDAAWSGVWRTGRWMTQVRLGDGSSTGPRERTLRGIALTNAPYRRPAYLGSETFGGRLGPGWQIEAYRGGRLISLDSADALGRFSLDVPLRYGENPVDFIAYGPFGETREFNQTYRVVGDLIPARTFEYGVSLGQCRSSLCQATGNLDLRYGVSRRWTLQGGVEQFWRDTLPDLFHPYASVTGNLTNSWLVQIEAVGGAVARGALSFEPSVDLRVTTEYNRFATGTTLPILTPSDRRSQWTSTLYLRPTPRHWGSLYVDGSLDWIDALHGQSTSGRLGLSFMAREIRFVPSVRFQNDAPAAGPRVNQTFWGLNTFILPQRDLGKFFGQVTGRTTFEMRGAASSSSSAFLSRYLARWLRVEVGGAWMRGTGTTWSLLLSTQIPSVRAYTTFTAPSQGGASASQFIQGSVLYNQARNGLDLAAGPSLERSGVSGRIFLDLNNDGKWQPGELLLPDVRLRLGTVSATSDSAGRYHIWDVQPYEPVLLVVDSASLKSPLWIPTYGAMSIEPEPNHYRVIDIPIAPGGVMEGRVVRETVTGLIGVGGLPLILVDSRTHAQRKLTTFSDGDFYAIGVRPGEYLLKVDETVLARLGLTAEPVKFTLAASEEGGTVEGLEIRLR